MKKAASSPTLSRTNLASTSPQPQKKQSWYANFRQKRSKKTSHNCKVRCNKKGAKHKCTYTHVYNPWEDDGCLLCMHMLEPCTEHEQARLKHRQAVIISEPPGSCYTIQDKKQEPSPSAPRGRHNYHPVVGDGPHVLGLPEVGVRCRFKTRKPEIIVDFVKERRDRHVDSEHKAIADLIEIVKTTRKQRAAKRHVRKLDFDVEKDNNDNVLLCRLSENKSETQDKQDEMQHVEIECIVDNVTKMSDSPAFDVQSDINGKVLKIERTNVNTNVSRLDEAKLINNNSNDLLTRNTMGEDSGMLIDNTNIDGKDNAPSAMQEFNYTGTDSTTEKHCPDLSQEGSLYSDCYLSSSGLHENFELDRLNQTIEYEGQHQNSPRKDVSPNLESSRSCKRLKVQDSNEDLTEMDCGLQVTPDGEKVESSMEGGSDVVEGLEDGDREEMLLPQGAMSSFYSYHVAASLVNNSSAIMLLIDHKMASGAIKSSCEAGDLAPDQRLSTLDPDILYFNEGDGEEDLDEASELVDIFQYGDPEDTIGQDNLLMSYTHSYMKKRNEDATRSIKASEASRGFKRSKSIGTSVSKAFTDALSKLEEISHDSRNKQFHKLFPEVPEDEEVINTYSCALCREILLHGRMFVSQNWICFHSNIFTYETQVVVRVSSITAITKERTAIVVPNAIGIVTQDEKHVFGSLLSRHATHKQLMKVWKGTTGTEDEDHSSSPASEDTDSECNYLPQKSVNSVESSELFNGNAMDEHDLPVPEDLDGDDEDSGVPRKRAASYRRKSSVEREDSVSQNTNQNCSKISKVVCAMSVFKSLLRIFSSLKDASHTQIFLGLTILLLICLTTSALVLSYRISKLEPHLQDSSWADSASVTPESLEGSFWSTQVNHKQKVAQIQDALTSHLESLSKIHSSLELLHGSTFTDKDQKDDHIPKDDSGS